MDPPLSPPQPLQQQQVHEPQPPVRVYGIDSQPPVMEDSSSLFDWGNLLEFASDDQFFFPFDSDQPPPTPPPPQPALLSPESSGSDRVRKRDPRLTCENFLSGRVPCACPELDAKLAEEEELEGGPGKKRARTVRAGTGTGRTRCQVIGCEADISELKGYHKRHRVCLGCANATSVLIDGQSRRYCQQCGKFHILTDFDEGKRSCRRKLERHNDRRRRKHMGTKDSADKETQGDLLGDDINCSFEAAKGEDNLSLGNQSPEKEELFEPEDGNISYGCSAPSSQIVHSDSVVSFGASDGGKQSSKCGLSSTHCDNKRAYSSMCPTGRISFKLYDWNPAEFPRRLRHQIFQWLASMPVELEGYIRPGCTILTVFVAMPSVMWAQLFEDPLSYVNDFVAAPGRLLSGKGKILVHLNHKIFQIVKDRTSIVKVDLKLRAPVLHYVHPTCFEAGKVMEFVACGSNLLQPKFRFLISFAGKYLAHESYVSLSDSELESESCKFDHQLYRICVPCTESNLSGPAFIEVENESGLSNFLPILIGHKEVCSEMEIIQQQHESSVFSNKSEFTANLSEVSITGQTPFSEFILDIAWLLKDPALETIQSTLTFSQIQRYSCLLDFLIYCDSTVLLERVVKSLKCMMSKAQMSSSINTTCGTDIMLLQKNIDHAGCVLRQKRLGLELQSQSFVAKDNCVSQSCSQYDMLSLVPNCSEDMETGVSWKAQVVAGSVSQDGGDTIPLLCKEVIMNMNHMKEWPSKSQSHALSNTRRVLSSHPLVFVIAATVICFGVCAVLFHPSKVGEFAISIRRCLFDKV